MNVVEPCPLCQPRFSGLIEKEHDCDYKRSTRGSANFSYSQFKQFEDNKNKEDEKLSQPHLLITWEEWKSLNIQIAHIPFLSGQITEIKNSLEEIKKLLEKNDAK